MLDFIKENKVIVGSALVILTMLTILGVVIFFPNTGTENDVDDSNPFGDVDGARVSDYTTDDFLFGTTSETWIANTTIGSKAPTLRALSRLPVAGATIIENTVDGSDVAYARFTSQNNGNIFETTLATVGEERLVSNEKILRIGVVDWSNNGLTSLTHYLDRTQQSITTHIRSMLMGTSTEQVFIGQILDDNIRSSAISPSGASIFYLKKIEEGTEGYVQNVRTGAKKLLWTTVLSDVTASWNSDSLILIYANPSSVAEGAIWALDPVSGKSSVILSNTLALAGKTNEAGTKILYSMQETKNSVFSLRVLDISNNSITHLPLAVMVEKCAWGPKDSRYVYCAIPRNTVAGGFLEEWYMGIKNSDDVIWRIDTLTNNTKKVLDPLEETEQRFDVEDIVVSPKEDYIVFRTRVNNVLWSLQLPGTTDTE